MIAQAKSMSTGVRELVANDPVTIRIAVAIQIGCRLTTASASGKRSEHREQGAKRDRMLCRTDCAGTAPIGD